MRIEKMILRCKGYISRLNMMRPLSKISKKAVLCLALVLLVSLPASAADNRVTVALQNIPSQIAYGQDFIADVVITTESDELYDSAQVIINYDTSYLQVVSMDSFPPQGWTEFSFEDLHGQIRGAWATLGDPLSVEGDALFGRIKFRTTGVTRYSTSIYCATYGTNKTEVSNAQAGIIYDIYAPYSNVSIGSRVKVSVENVPYWVGVGEEFSADLYVESTIDDPYDSVQIILDYDENILEPVSLDDVCPQDWTEISYQDSDGKIFGAWGLFGEPCSFEGKTLFGRVWFRVDQPGSSSLNIIYSGEPSTKVENGQSEIPYVVDYQNAYFSTGYREVTVALENLPPDIPKGRCFEVDLSVITDPEETYDSVQIVLDYDETKLEVIDLIQTFPPEWSQISFLDMDGQVRGAWGLLGTPVSADGRLTFGRIKFRAISEGESFFSFVTGTDNDTRISNLNDGIEYEENSSGISVEVTPPVNFSDTDFDGDGDADILLRRLSDGKMLLWTMEGNEFQSYQWLTGYVGMDWKVSGVSDFDKDGDADIMLRRLSDGKMILWTMEGNEFQEYQWLTGYVGMDWKVSGVSDFDKDGDADILLRRLSDGKMLVWTMEGNEFQEYHWLTGYVGMDWKVSGVSDFDKDGDADILLRRESDGKMLLWTMEGEQFQSYQWITGQVGTGWLVGECADFDKDGDADILLRRENDGKMLIWTMEGNEFQEYEWLSGYADKSWEPQVMEEPFVTGEPLSSSGIELPGGKTLSASSSEVVEMKEGSGETVLIEPEGEEATEQIEIMGGQDTRLVDIHGDDDNTASSGCNVGCPGMFALMLMLPLLILRTRSGK